MRIRKARAADLSAIEELVLRAYGPYIAQIGIRPGPMDDDYAEKVRRGHAFVAAEDDAILGLIVLVHRSDHLLVENVAVDPGRQGEGLGRALLAFADDAAREGGHPTVRLYTHARMARNLAFYRRLGFEETDRRTDDGFERVFFSKRLGA